MGDCLVRTPLDITDAIKCIEVHNAASHPHGHLIHRWFFDLNQQLGCGSQGDVYACYTRDPTGPSPMQESEELVIKITKYEGEIPPDLVREVFLSVFTRFPHCSTYIPQEGLLIIYLLFTKVVYAFLRKR